MQRKEQPNRLQQSTPCREPNRKTDDTFFINAVINAHLPDAVTIEMVQKATNEDDVLAKLKFCIIKKGYIPTHIK